MPKAADVKAKCKRLIALAPLWGRATLTQNNSGCCLTEDFITIYVLMSVRTRLQHFRAIARINPLTA